MSRRVTKWFATLATTAALALPGLASATNAMNDIGIGVKSKGMGGVGVALPQDSFASAFNPAGMSYLCNRFDLGFSWTWQEGYADYFNNTADLPFVTKNKTTRGMWYPDVGIVWDFCPSQAFGLAIYMNGGFDTSYKGIFPEIGVTNLAGQYRQLFVTPSWSWRINQIHAVGVAVNVAVSWVQLQGMEILVLNSIFPNDFTDRGTDFEEGVSVRFGWLGCFCGCFKLGATFQTKTWTSRFKKYQGFFVNAGEADLAPEAGLGFAWNLCECLTIAGDFIYRVWTSPKEFDYNARESGVILAGFGTGTGPGFGWNDTPVVKLGIAWQALPCLALRAGYNFGENPIAPTETYLNRLTLVTPEHHVTLGATWVWCKCNELSVYYYHGFERVVKGRDSTSGLDEVNISNSQNSAGISYGRRF